MLHINNHIAIPMREIKLKAIRSKGPGGQHVNKVSSAIQLKYHIKASSLPDNIKVRLASIADQRISQEGIIIIKAQQHRSQLKNKQVALDRLKNIIEKALEPQKERLPLKISKAAKKRRIENKKKQSLTKQMRKKVEY